MSLLVTRAGGRWYILSYTDMVSAFVDHCFLPTVYLLSGFIIYFPLPAIASFRSVFCCSLAFLLCTNEVREISVAPFNGPFWCLPTPAEARAVERRTLIRCLPRSHPLHFEQCFILLPPSPHLTSSHAISVFLSVLPASAPPPTDRHHICRHFKRALFQRNPSRRALEKP